MLENILLPELQSRRGRGSCGGHARSGMLAHSVQRVWSVETNSHADAIVGRPTSAGDSGKDDPRDIVGDDVMGKSRALSPTLLKWGIVAVVTVIAAVLTLAYLTPAQGGTGNCGRPNVQPVSGENHCGQ